MKHHPTFIVWWSPWQVSRNTNEKVLFMCLCFPFLYEVVCFFITLFIQSSDIFRKDAQFFTLMHLSNTQLIFFTSNSQMSILSSMPGRKKIVWCFLCKIGVKVKVLNIFVSFIFIFSYFQMSFSVPLRSFFNDVKICVTSYFMYMSHEGRYCTFNQILMRKRIKHR